MNMIKKNIITGVITTFSLCSFAYADGYLREPLQKAKEDTVLYSVDQLTSGAIGRLKKGIDESKINGLRAEAIKDVALRLGSSSGLAAQFRVYEQALENRSAELDKQYNFESLKLSAGVLPPVLSQSFSNYEKKDDNQVEIADKTFVIEAPAKFVSVYPTWRDYLKFNFKPAELPSSAFLPKSSIEKQLWDKYVKDGWDEGVRQAHEIYQEAMGTLNRDYEGMILYKTLLMQGLITPTIVASSNLGVTGDGTTMSVGHKVVRITEHSRFNQNNKNWKNKNPATYKDKNNKKF